MAKLVPSIDPWIEKPSQRNLGTPERILRILASLDHFPPVHRHPLDWRLPP